MALNCKPGDLAIVVTAGCDPDCNKWVGRLVTVRSITAHPTSGLPCWSYDPPALRHPIYGDCLHIADTALRPIRDPGDDAVDEMLRHVGAPLRDDELALIFFPEAHA